MLILATLQQMLVLNYYKIFSEDLDVKFGLNMFDFLFFFKQF